jgi:hypothetical protein
MEKYIALYPKSNIESQEVLGKRERIRQELREEMLNGKKKSSGSNQVKLGVRKSINMELQEINSEDSSLEDDQTEERESDKGDL